MTLLDVEIAQRDEPILWDVRVDPAAAGAATGEVPMSAPTIPVTATRWAAADREPLVIDDPATGRLPMPPCSRPMRRPSTRPSARGRSSGAGRVARRERGRVLRRIAQLVREHADDLAGFESQEMGKPVSQARHRSRGVHHAVRVLRGLVEAMPSAIS